MRTCVTAVNFISWLTANRCVYPIPHFDRSFSASYHIIKTLIENILDVLNMTLIG